MATNFMLNTTITPCNDSSYYFNLTTNLTSQGCNASRSTHATVIYPEIWEISLSIRIILISLYSSIFIIGVSGNTMVCYVLGKKKKLTGGDTLVISLAISDLLASLFVPIIMVTDLSNKSNIWYFGATLCKILPSISPMTLVASSWSLMLIAIDRYWVITHPLQPRLSTKLKIIGIIVVWLFAIGITIPYAISQGLYQINSIKICIDQGILSQIGRNIYVTSWIVTGWGIPFIIICFLYCYCIKELHKIPTSSMNKIAINQRKKENKRVTEMFIIVVCLFFIFTTPYSLMYVIFNYLLTYRRNEIDLNIIMKWNYALFVMTTSNSCMNPIIYAKLHKEINPFMKKVAKKICCKFNCIKQEENNKYEISICESSKRETTKTTDINKAFYSNKAFDSAQ